MVTIIHYICTIVTSLIIWIFLHKFQLLHRIIRQINGQNFAKFVTNWQNKEKSKLFIIADNLINLNQNLYYKIDSEDDVVKFISQLQKIDPMKTVDIILHTRGGDSYNAKIIVDALMNHSGQRRIFIPYNAYSSGTFIALTGHHIYMNKNAHLSPIDTQIIINDDNLFSTPIPVNVLSTLSHVSKNTQSNLLTIHTKIAEKDCYADLHKLDIIFSKLYPYKDSEKQKIISNFLCTQLPHNYPISVDEARKFGLSISCQMPQIMDEIEYFLH